MADLNSVTLIGRATKDVELHSTKNGDNITTLTIASNSSNNRVSYFDVVLYDKAAEIASMYVKKGTQVAVSGKLQQRRWEKDGILKYSVEIAGYQLQLLGKRESAAQDIAPIDDNISLADLPF